MKSHLPTLLECPLFAEIGGEDLLRMLACLGARIEHFDRRETVLAEGGQAHRLGVVLSGEVQIEQVDYYGNRSILSRSGRGALFGEAFACAEVATLPVTVVASEACEVMFLEASHILHTCSNACGFHHRLIYNLMRDLAEESLRFHRRIEVTSKRTTREKLLTYLSLMAREQGGARVEIPYDRQELADYLEVERSGLSTEIGKLRREGVLRCEKKRFELL